MQGISVGFIRSRQSWIRPPGTTVVGPTFQCRTTPRVDEFVTGNVHYAFWQPIWTQHGFPMAGKAKLFSSDRRGEQ
jgi:hypothetical protein